MKFQINEQLEQDDNTSYLLRNVGIWWLVDWIRVLTDTFPDGNGLPLKDDMQKKKPVLS